MAARATVLLVFLGAGRAWAQICAGTCPDSSACSAAVDCAGCAFPDACLPGGSFGISAVVDDSVLGANQYDLYIGPPITGTTGALSWRNVEPTAVTRTARLSG